jgi:hypothetical protein
MNLVPGGLAFQPPPRRELDPAREAQIRSDLDYVRYLSLITGEGRSNAGAPTRFRPCAGGAKEWKLDWDLEMSVWEFRPRSRAVAAPAR